MKEIVTTEDFAGQRLDQIHAHISDVSRSQFKQHISAGYVKVNKERSEPSYKLKKGDKITYNPVRPKKDPLAVPIIFEDDRLLVINKPAGMLMHDRGNDETEYTVADFARSKTKDDDPTRPGIVHRLDRETSGLVVIAKTQPEKQRLQTLFAKRQVQKEYVAICEGVIPDQKARFEWPIQRDSRKPFQFRVHPDGKPAVTLMKVQEQGSHAARVLLCPETGRTHQLRVHMHNYGHAICGDQLYGASNSDHMYLHARRLRIPNEDGSVGEWCTVEPWDQQAVNNLLHGNANDTK